MSLSAVCEPDEVVNVGQLRVITHLPSVVCADLPIFWFRRHDQVVCFNVLHKDDGVMRPDSKQILLSPSQSWWQHLQYFLTIIHFYLLKEDLSFFFFHQFIVTYNVVDYLENCYHYKPSHSFIFSIWYDKMWQKKMLKDFPVVEKWQGTTLPWTVTKLRHWRILQIRLHKYLPTTVKLYKTTFLKSVYY